MMPVIKLLPPAERARNRRRWSFRFSSLTTLTALVAGVWMATPAEWHPNLPEWSKYLIMGLAVGLALLANASHMIEQPTLHTGDKTDADAR
jgi:hypothetical protein